MKYIFSPGDTEKRKDCVYRKDDLTLVYLVQPSITAKVEKPQSLSQKIDEQIFGLKENKFFVIAETLTIVFDRRTKRFLGLDAYTNMDRWKQVKNMMPKIFSQGTLHISELPETADRLSVDVMPQYETNRKQGWMKIILSNHVGHNHYEIGEDLVMGFDTNMIYDIYLFNIKTQ